MKHLPTRPRLPQSGFSLVEVALAVAIAALAIITLLGLLPQGLEMSRKTSLISTDSNILDQIIRNYESMSFADLKKAGNSGITKCYTDQGLEVGTDSKEISYVASITISQTPTLPQGDTNALPLYLRPVVIKIASTSNPGFDFGPNNKIAYASFNYLIAKSR